MQFCVSIRVCISFEDNHARTIFLFVSHSFPLKVQHKFSLSSSSGPTAITGAVEKSERTHSLCIPSTTENRVLYTQWCPWYIVCFKCLSSEAVMSIAPKYCVLILMLMFDYSNCYVGFDITFSFFICYTLFLASSGSVQLLYGIYSVVCECLPVWLATS